MPVSSGPRSTPAGSPTPWPAPPPGARTWRCSPRRPRSGSARTCAPRPSRWTAPFCSGLAAAAKRTGVALVAGVFEPAPDGRVYNTAVAYDGDRRAGRRLPQAAPVRRVRPPRVRRGGAGFRAGRRGRSPGSAPAWRSATTCGSASCPGRSRWPGPSCSCCPPPGRPGCSRRSTGSPWCGPAPSRTPSGWRPSARCPTRTNRPPGPRPASAAACWSTRSAWSGPTSGPRPGVTVAEVDTGLIATVRASLPSLANRRDDVFGPAARLPRTGPGWTGEPRPAWGAPAGVGGPAGMGAPAGTAGPVADPRLPQNGMLPAPGSRVAGPGTCPPTCSVPVICWGARPAEPPAGLADPAVCQRKPRHATTRRSRPGSRHRLACRRRRNPHGPPRLVTGRAPGAGSPARSYRR